MDALTDSEISEFLKKYPETESLTLGIVDVLGLLRGKKISADKIRSLAKAEISLPASILCQNSRGRNFDIPETSPADPDFPVTGISGTLLPTPWKKRREAQVLVSLSNDNQTPSIFNGREILRKIIQRFEEDFGLFPCASVELEFFLFSTEKNGNKPEESYTKLKFPFPHLSQCYSFSRLDSYAAFFDELYDSLKAQGIQVEAESSEYGPGQFEVNMPYDKNTLRACDKAVLLKYAVKSIAAKHGFLATFMATPQSGVTSGTHFNLSFFDRKKHNIFSEETAVNPEKQRNSPLFQAIAGMKETAAHAMLLLAPNPNSHKRFLDTCFSPGGINWGFNNRTVSLRIPRAKGSASRIEHRLAGADANPYLVAAAVLAGCHYGMKNKRSPGKAFTGSAYDSDSPIKEWIGMETAIKKWLEPENVLADYFPADFVDFYGRHRYLEWKEVNAKLTSTDFEWYLDY